MARSLPPRMVQCYQCDHRFEVGGSAQSTSCPGCNRPVMVADQIIKGQRGPIRELKTCGKVVVGKRGRLICQHIVAHAGLECEGIIDAKTVVSNTRVVLGAKANFRGDLTAPGVAIAQGAVIQSSYFRIGEPPPGYVPPPPTDPKKTLGADHPAPTPGAGRTAPVRAKDSALPSPGDADTPVVPSPKKPIPKKKAPKKKTPTDTSATPSATPPAPTPASKPVAKPAAPTPTAPSKDDTPAKPAAKPAPKPAAKPAAKKLKPAPEPAPEPTTDPATEPAGDTTAPKKKAPKRRAPAPEGDAAPKKKLPKRRKPSGPSAGTDDASAFAVLAQWLSGVRVAMRSFLF